MPKTFTDTQVHIIETALEVAAAQMCTAIKHDERTGDFDRAALMRLAQTYIGKARDVIGPAPMRSPRVADLAANSIRDALSAEGAFDLKNVQFTEGSAA